MNRYLVMAMRSPDFDPAMVQPHLDFLQGLRTGGRLELSGGFSDETGGAYLMLAPSLDEALVIVQQDPAYTCGGWDITVYEWQAR
ncbi:MAG TPA: YciI family protein [Dyella sp.]|uniref:YciI family protein n=1 Tax=Dyella sp. TaxID=1869338 RepID=UPI002D76EBF5|nr:YciI family protein [Dyella sp.]HET6554467.1 YciI family protein [Dyella sp.]